MTVEVRTIERYINGVLTPSLTAGPESDQQAVVFVHGNPGSAEDWRDLLTRVGRTHRAIAPTLPGFGQADKPREFDHSLWSYARHLGTLLDKLDVRRAHLVLHDFGGAWGLAWAGANPKRFASVVLINTGILPGYRWHSLARVWRTPGLGELAMATLTRFGFRKLMGRGYQPPGLPREFVDRTYDDFDRRSRRAFLRVYRSMDDPGGETAQNLSDGIRPLDRPALVLWGKRDPYIPVEYAQRQAEVFPRSRVVILEGSGHWPLADDPERTAAEVLPFLSEQLAGG